MSLGTASAVNVAEYRAASQEMLNIDFTDSSSSSIVCHKQDMRNFIYGAG